ncbi:MAG: hypothetical protein QM811_30065 [Pirellulales bacterium]
MIARRVKLLYEPAGGRMLAAGEIPAVDHARLVDQFQTSDGLFVAQLQIQIACDAEVARQESFVRAVQEQQPPGRQHQDARGEIQIAVKIRFQPGRDGLAVDQLACDGRAPGQGQTRDRPIRLTHSITPPQTRNSANENVIGQSVIGHGVVTHCHFHNLIQEVFANVWSQTSLK